MTDNNKDFDFTYSAPSKTERRIIESIKNEYEQKTVKLSKFELLKKLDKKVRYLPKMIMVIFYIAGTLCFGFGISLVLVWSQYIIGSLTSAVGIAIAIVTHPIYKKIFKFSKKKYKEEILLICNELSNT